MTVEETKSGISRRDLIKKGAVAGAVFWSVPVIESVTSAAAAASGGCVTFNASWLYVVYTYNGITYFSGFSKGDATGSCTPGSNPTSHGTFTTQSCNGVFYELTNFSGTPTDGGVLYGPTLPPLLPAVYVGGTATIPGGPTCSSYVKIDPNQPGRVIPATTGVTIVAAFCFGAGSLTGGCVGASNDICAACE